MEAATRACQSDAARAEHAAERVEAVAARRGRGALVKAEAEAEAEVEAEVRTAALAPARRPLRAARPLADAASAAELRVPLPLLQIKGPKPSRLHKSVAMHVAVPDGPVKLKPRDASVSAEGDRWLPSYPHAARRAYTTRTHHAHTPRAHTSRTHAAHTPRARTPRTHHAHARRAHTTRTHHAHARCGHHEHHRLHASLRALLPGSCCTRSAS